VASGAYPLRLPTRLPVLWRVMVLSLTLGALLSRLLAWADGESFRSVPTLWIMAVAAPSVLLTYIALPARAGEAGLKLFDRFGLPRRFAWSEIRDVQLTRWPYLLFAPSLKVTLVDGRVRWLPRESGRLSELHALALRVVGPAHPLVKALETPLHRL
jgi:hypothetical protein